MANIVRYQIEHVTKYRYGLPVHDCAMHLALKPMEDRGQHVSRFLIETEPAGSLFQVTDCFGNTRHQLHLYREHLFLDITARSAVDTIPADSPPERCEDGAWETIRGWRDSFHHWDFMDHSGLTRPSSALKRFVRRNGIEPVGDPLAALKRLSGLLFDCFEYVPGSTSISSTIEHILDTGRGVCQDYAHVMIAIARTWGIPARYVSGYLHDATDRGATAGTTAGTTTHAWVECLLPGLGWTGFDPTNSTFVDERHVRVAVGRDYRDVSPTRGVLHGGGDIRLDVEVRMQPVSGNHTDTSIQIQEEPLR